ncbi:MAG: sterol desaturase family protein [Solirubrobacterales bacterium]|nr:sterol desaturase family protein [Solirubrobacterales bacterium]
MFDLVLYAVPFFIALVLVEWFQFRHDRAEEREQLVGYEGHDTATSLTMGVGYAVINTGWKLVVATAYAGIYELTPLRISPQDWWAWPLLFFADDLAYYWFHRISHVCRIFWASHVVHHSSQHYNLSTALRQTWTPMGTFIFWIPLALIGFKPWMILLEQSVSLTYQFWIHTERVGTLWRPIELIFNTPSHHRVHHGSNDQYLDKNFGGILIIWDRLFGSFIAEREQVQYGLTRNIGTFNPLKVATHEYVAIYNDVRHARTWSDRFNFLFRGPGWAYDHRDPADLGELTERQPA